MYSSLLAPIGHSLVRRDATADPTCASCDSLLPESFAHILDCPGHSAWRTRAEKEFNNDMIALGTPRCIRTTLVHVLFGKRGCPPGSSADLHSDCMEIGRLEVWRGRFPLSATETYQKFKQDVSDDCTKSLTGSQWSKKVVTLILQMVLDLWWFRNKRRHGNDHEEEANIKRKRALQRCTELGARVKRLTKHRDLFVLEDKLEKWNTGMIVHYLKWAEPLVTKLEKAPNCEPRPAQKWDVTNGEVYDPP